MQAEGLENYSIRIPYETKQKIRRLAALKQLTQQALIIGLIEKDYAKISNKKVDEVCCNNSLV